MRVDIGLSPEDTRLLHASAVPVYTVVRGPLYDANKNPIALMELILCVQTLDSIIKHEVFETKAPG